MNQPTNAIGDGPYDPRANVSQRPLEEIVRDEFSSMTTPDNAIKYLFANVQHIVTPISIQNWQQVLDAADADVAIFVGTKLTTNRATKISRGPIRGWVYPGYPVLTRSDTF